MPFELCPSCTRYSFQSLKLVISQAVFVISYALKETAKFDFYIFLLHLTNYYDMDNIVNKTFNVGFGLSYFIRMIKLNKLACLNSSCQE